MKLSQDDDYIWTPSYSKVPRERLQLPGLHMIGRARFRKAWDALDTHYHKTMEIVVVINGSQQYIVNDTMYSLYGGTMFLTRPNEIHGNGKMPQNVCEFIWFQLELHGAENFLGLSGEQAQYLYSRIINNKRRTIDVSHKDLELLQQVWEQLTSSQSSRRFLGNIGLIQFLATYFCDEPHSAGGGGVSPDIQRARQYIDQNLTSDLRIAGIAERCHISESHFKTKFRVQMGITPLGYITSQRIELAKRMLKYSGESITDIAISLNFSSSNYYSSVFKQYTGYSPSEFRYAKRFDHS